ncbi:cbb3-type cytochrome oxidase assembly protein CcoS [Sphingomicrobium sediminis]|uniref:Cbb3-type cytochrome oxidase assembly protein CcoS n=1 Tax=Sphingomicrobium sediminis TaxID=2950949 RepID=A0A9X2EIN2_9SPHN|nr:cbb3-type cytochrome oxidase assembly protein CcoS [Sphingomicrobium sediminis]
MTAVGYLLPIALLLGTAGLAGFFWTMKSGQYEDLDGAAHRILIDDETIDAGQSEGETDVKEGEA